MIEVKNLTVGYEGPSVLNDVNFNLLEGSIFGVMGKNGSGKTTLIKTILGELPYEGSVTYSTDLLDSKKRISKETVFYVSDSPFIYDYLSGIEFVLFLLNLKGGRYVEKKEILNVFEFFGLSEQDSSKLMKDYSFGMKRKTLLTAGFLLNPKLMILDEPTIGLDVPSVIALKKLIQEYCKRGSSVLVTSHDPSLMSELCDRLIILDNKSAVYYNENFKDEKRDLSTLYLDLVGENLTQKISDFFEPFNAP